MTTSTGGDALLAAVEQLRERAGATALPLVLDGVTAARRERAALVDQLDDYVLPRLRAPQAPLLAVVGGSTGAGKSTLVNSLLRRTVTRGGVLRPTTRSPVLVHHPDDLTWFEGPRVLPGLERTSGAPALTRRAPEDESRISTVHLTASDALPPGLALLDAPDIDSVVAANRELAQQLLAAADLWLFVTSAARYADAVPWALLHGAATRGSAVAVVLDRVPQPAVPQLREHLAAMLRERQLAATPMFVVPEVPVDEQGLLPERVVAPVLGWLSALALDESARQTVVGRTLAGWLDTMTVRTGGLVTALGLQRLAHERLRVEAAEAYDEGRRALDRSLADGSLQRGEVLARWHELLGTGELQALRERATGVRDRLAGALRGRSRGIPDLAGAIGTTLQQLLQSGTQQAAEGAARRWRASPGGQQLLAEHPGLQRAAAAGADQAAGTVREWQDGVAALLHEQDGERRADDLVVGERGLVGLVMLLAVGPRAAGGDDPASTAPARRVLEAVLGEQGLRTLVAQVRADLVARASALLELDHARYVAALDLAAGTVDVAALERAAQDVERARTGRRG